MVLPLSQLASKALLRHYSSQTPHITPTFLERVAVKAYLCAAFTLPLVPAYVATQQSKQDGTWETRPRMTFPVLRPHF